MAKASLMALVLKTVCISFLISFALAAEKLNVVGKVYCDTCRVEFETKLSEPISGATVKLECKKEKDDVMTFSREAVTNATGGYSIPVEGDHYEEICWVRADKSPRADCNQRMEAWERSQVELSGKDGLAEPTRTANNLGFKKKEALPGCPQVLKEMGFPNGKVEPVP
ncbi:Alg9-like mannosyltransferase family isoform 1 [Hibiscus syriacus]|uniref:Alg9-like mannosyltransferase family isoform 1 n=1 Tax=Hibiscus syriacus TaxID=106335 RepID=A0A6A2XFT2_HIBSY|nr:anther-specific protein LAT52-like [Hibiscus syriacus]KAE8668590.1 Alg9-like mannosyltransferase family isoform 1 [Hibiscus syriacus]